MIADQILIVILNSRYPFHGAEHTGLFAKIRRGQFNLPDSLSSRAKCLIRCLLKKEPEERLTTEDVLVHPWLLAGSSRERGRRPAPDASDQAVPAVMLPASAAGEREPPPPKSTAAAVVASVVLEQVFRSPPPSGGGGMMVVSPPPPSGR